MLIDDRRLAFLTDLTADVVEASRVYPGQRRGSSPANTTGITLIVPGATDWYPAFWTEDLTLSLESGCISPDEAKGMLRLVLETQNGPAARHLKSGGTIPPYAIPNHILLSGEPVSLPRHRPSHGRGFSGDAANTRWQR